MRTFLLIVAVSLSSAANVKREAEAEATAEADASADPAYGRHHGHAGQTEKLETNDANSETLWEKPTLFVLTRTSWTLGLLRLIQ